MSNLETGIFSINFVITYYVKVNKFISAYTDITVAINRSTINILH